MSRARHKKNGGGLKAYAGGESATAKEAMDKTSSFKRGGKASKASGKKAAKRSDKPMRKASGGGVKSPFSSAAGSKGRPGGSYSGKATDSHDD